MFPLPVRVAEKTRGDCQRLKSDDMERVELFFDRQSGCDVVFRNAWLPNYQARAISDCWVLTSSSGAWRILAQDEFASLRSVAIPQTLFRNLEADGLIITEENSASIFQAYKRWTTPHFRHPVH